MFKKLAAVAGVASLALMTTGAQAAVVVTEVVSEIEAAAAPIALVGTAMLILFVGIKSFKWVRRALS